MSLISDALKTAQREKGVRAQTGKNPQPLIDGFFPYVSTSPDRSRSKLVPVVAISVAGIALLTVAGWFVLPSLIGGSKVPQRQSPIVSPPRGVAAAPLSRDSVAAAADTQATVAAGEDLPAARSETPGVSSRVRRDVAPDNRVAVRAVDPQSSRTDTSVARAVVPRVETSPPPVDHEAQAAALFNAGDFVGARDRFLLATRVAPTARAWTNYGVTLQRLGDLTGAAAAYQSAIGIDANYLEAWLYQGRLAVDLGDVAKAIPLFQRARSINPRHSEVNVELARLESEAKNWTETRRFAEDAVRGDPTNARAHWYLAIATDQLKDFEAAAREYTAYLQTVGAAEREQARFVGWARQRLTELRGKP